MTNESVQEQVRARYAAAAAVVTGAQGGCCGPRSAVSCCAGTEEPVGHFGADRYPLDERITLPQMALDASLGCGNPVMVAELRPGETVLDLGSGGGIDVLLSARRVGPTGFVFGVDMTDEMLALARSNQAKAGLTNVVFLKGTIEAVPLPEASIDVVISNCVINLSVDKTAVFAEMFRLLKPGGRLGVADIVAEDHLTPADRATRGSYVSCIAGALSRSEYVDGLHAAGFADVTVEFTDQVVPDMHSALIRATKPGPS